MPSPASLRSGSRNRLASPAGPGVRVPVDDQAGKSLRVPTPEQADAIVAAAENHDARLGRSLGGPLFALAFGTVTSLNVV